MIAAALAFALLPPAASPEHSGTVSGQVVYEDKEFGYPSGFTGSYPQLPVRYADVVIEEPGGTVLAEGSTDAAGDFSIFVPQAGPQTFLVRVKALSSNAAAADPRLSNVRVRDFATASVFTVVSPTFNGVDGPLDVGTIVCPRVVESHGKEGNPFNMFDLLVDSVRYMTDPVVGGLAEPSGTLTVRWPEPGDNSYAGGSQATIGYRAGYDDTIILHEIGHLIHNAYSVSSNPGGAHFVGDSDQDPRLSYGEGYASFFSGAVRQWNGTPDPGVYVSSNGNPGAGGFGFGWRYETSSPYGAVGDADELAVCNLLWDWVDGEDTLDNTVGADDDVIVEDFTFAGGLTGEQVWQEVFTGPLNTTGTKTLIAVWNKFFTPVDYGNRDEVMEVFESFTVRYWNDVYEPDQSFEDAWLAWPIPNGFWRAENTIYFNDTPPFAPGGGDTDWVAFNAEIGASVTARTRYPNGLNDAGTMADPYLEVTDAYGTVLFSDDDGASGRNARIDFVAPATGTYYTRVSTNHSFRRLGRYQLSIAVSERPPLWWAGESFRTGQIRLNLETDPLSDYEIYYSLQTDSVPTPEGTLLLRNPKLLLTGTASAAGQETIERTIPNKPGLAGRSVYLQALHGDPAELSNRIEVFVQ